MRSSSATRVAAPGEAATAAGATTASGGTGSPHVLIACSGLDHARRGFESFARECFEELSDEAGLQIELAKGSGPSGPRERAVPTLRRDRAIARAMAGVIGARPFRVEALAFALSLQPLLATRHPDVVYLSEWDTARGLAAVRSLTRQRFKVVLSNGGFAWRGFDHIDRVQELTPAARDYVLARGADAARHAVLPLGFRIEPELRLISVEERAALRASLGIPTDRTIVTCVSALNRTHKRIDYLIDEIAAIPDPRPYLLLAGEPDAETPGLRRQALELLGAEGHTVRTVPATEVPQLLRASDAFVLASLVEAQGRSLIEAASQGLPCFAHDSEVMRFALGEHGRFADMTHRGALTQLLGQLGAPDAHLARALHRHVYERFSWDSLRPRYVELFTTVANSTVSSSTGENVSRYSR